ncbi:MAG: SDR family oxidoreductase [Amaricoccus sp.]|uniref:SDR family NAD(P)-dependent oxidoreductase n=1 Tax=Amaricoccus sp. TaxID=1872485 RepID=UPI0039E4EC42
MTRPLAGQGVILTGAAQGLGAAIARLFAARGAWLALLDYNRAALEETVAHCGAEAMGITVDLSDAAATEEAIMAAFAQLGRVDTVIHNAAILDPRPFEDETLGSFCRTVQVGLQAGFQLARAAWPGMSETGGTLIFVSSRSGIEGFANETAYCAAKHALEGLAKSLTLEGADRNIRCHVVTPGMYMRTPMSERNYDEAARRNWIDPDKLAPAFMYLAEGRARTDVGTRINTSAHRS